LTTRADALATVLINHVELIGLKTGLTLGKKAFGKISREKILNGKAVRRYGKIRREKDATEKAKRRYGKIRRVKRCYGKTRKIP
jgi:hypothetical protein